MSSPTGGSSAARATASPNGDGRPEPIKAIRLHHPWRIVFAVVLFAALALFIIDAAQRPAYGWENFSKYIFDRRISQAAVDHPDADRLLDGHRDHPRDHARHHAAVREPRRRRSSPGCTSGCSAEPLCTCNWCSGASSPRSTPALTSASRSPTPWMSFETKAAVDVFWFAVIGLSLNEAAYMAEIVRAGILSVDRGQDEAATALGMSWMQTMRRVIIPQAMRIIIPPTGNEVISMLKTTSLVTAVPFSFDLYGRAAGHLRRDLRPHPAAARGFGLVPAVHLHPHGRPVLPGEAVLPRRRAGAAGEEAARRTGRRSLTGRRHGRRRPRGSEGEQRDDRRPHGARGLRVEELRLQRGA